MTKILKVCTAAVILKGLFIRYKAEAMPQGESI